MMKYHYVLLFLGILLCGISFCAKAQYAHVNKYFTVVKTSRGTIKGTLHEVTDSTVHVVNTKGEAVIPYQIIKKVIIKKFNKTQMLVADTPSNSQKTLPNEEIQNDHSGIVVGTAAVIGQAANVVAFSTQDESTYYTASMLSFAVPLLGMLFKDEFSSIDRFVIHKNLRKFGLCKPELEIYSIVYQMH